MAQMTESKGGKGKTVSTVTAGYMPAATSDCKSSYSTNTPHISLLGLSRVCTLVCACVCGYFVSLKLLTDKSFDSE